MRYRKVYKRGHPKADRKGFINEHVLIAETALGKALPDGAEVHHVDENRRNNARRNLVICQDHQYHRMLHARARVVRAGGNPDTQKICGACGLLKPLSDFHRFARNQSNGRQPNCADCDRVRVAERRKRLRSAA